MPDSVAGLTNEFLIEIKKLYKERLNKVILFGSYARGEQREDSDVDYLVVLNDEEIKTLKEISFISPVTSSLGLKYGLWVSAIPVSLKKMDRSMSVLSENIEEEGIVV